MEKSAACHFFLNTHIYTQIDTHTNMERLRLLNLHQSYVASSSEQQNQVNSANDQILPTSHGQEAMERAEEEKEDINDGGELLIDLTTEYPDNSTRKRQSERNGNEIIDLTLPTTASPQHPHTLTGRRTPPRKDKDIETMRVVRPTRTQHGEEDVMVVGSPSSSPSSASASISHHTTSPGINVNFLVLAVDGNRSTPRQETRRRGPLRSNDESARPATRRKITASTTTTNTSSSRPSTRWQNHHHTPTVELLEQLINDRTNQPLSSRVHSVDEVATVPSPDRLDKPPQIADTSKPSLSNPVANEEPSPQAPTLSCPICWESKNSMATTNCGHVFCHGCITDWVRRKACCPTCRKRLTQRQIVRLYI